jgi:hypothetical protein
MEVFRDTLEDCNLCDLGYVGARFTWCNNHEDASFTKERLDRAVATPSWCAKFGEVDVFILAAQNSDHCPLFVHSGGEEVLDSHDDENFKFEASWLVNDACSRWLGKPGELLLWGVILWILYGINLTHAGNTWLAGITRDRSKRKWPGSERQTKKIEALQESLTAGTVPVIKQYEGAVTERLEREDLKWRQRAKIHWLQQGDRNTKFFHLHANNRKKRNCIREIRSEAGTIYNSPSEIGDSLPALLSISVLILTPH